MQYLRRRADAVWMMSITALTVGCSARVHGEAIPTQPAVQPVFVFDDAIRFAQAHLSLSTVADTAAFLDSAFIGRGTKGLRAYGARYPLTGDGLDRAITSFPEDYAAVGARAAWLSTQRDSMARVTARYREFAPDAVILPVYFVVVQHQGIASGSEAGPLVSIENGAADVSGGSLSKVLAHEMTHIHQFSAVGLPRYRELYTTNRSLLGVVIREGAAEFVADLVAGGVTQQRAANYLRGHLPRVWSEFKEAICDADNGDWVGGTPRAATRPPLLGYALGAAVARSLYDRAADKRAAFRRLLTSDDYRAILLDSGFHEQFGESRSDLGATLATCRRDTKR